MCSVVFKSCKSCLEKKAHKPWACTKEHSDRKQKDWRESIGRHACVSQDPWENCQEQFNLRGIVAWMTSLHGYTISAMLWMAKISSLKVYTPCNFSTLFDQQGPWCKCTGQDHKNVCFIRCSKVLAHQLWFSSSGFALSQGGQNDHHHCHCHSLTFPF